MIAVLLDEDIHFKCNEVDGIRCMETIVKTHPQKTTRNSETDVPFRTLLSQVQLETEFDN